MEQQQEQHKADLKQLKDKITVLKQAGFIGKESNSHVYSIALLILFLILLALCYRNTKQIKERNETIKKLQEKEKEYEKLKQEVIELANKVPTGPI